jgi:branched-chain amino acid transport system substrate-binding protein
MLSVLLAASFTTGAALAQKGETVKIAWIDPLSGLMASVGQSQLRAYQFFAEKFNASNPAGVKFEVISIDNKLSPAETTNALKSAIDQGVRYVVQGLGSGAAGALVDAINKYNERNPGKEVVYLNYAAVDPDLTNSKCSFWHFPAGCRHLHEDGGHDHLHERSPRGQEGLPDQPELRTRPAGVQVRQGHAGPQAP